ncbi:MAG: ATP-binding cassette domain-containing protein [Micromonosporaceae bacterium]|nr:ATP-binding cassette domain-containing protein [Micromonosporaceae bacterium]
MNTTGAAATIPNPREGALNFDPGEPGPTLTVTGVTVAYDGRPVLRDVTVTARPGQILAVTGPSGAGKTTLLSTMAGLIRPERGAVRLGEQLLRSRDQAVRLGVVIVPQDNGLAPILTASENIQVALIANKVAPGETRRRAAEAPERVGLAEQANQLVEELSGGQQQRTALARGLALQGCVLLADEVTSELDAQNRERVLQLLRAEADRGAAVVFATHDPEAAAACDSELHLSDGTATLLR